MARTNMQDLDQVDKNAIIGMIFSFLESTHFSSLANWILDSGATSHICHSLSLFHSHDQLSNEFVQLPNCTKIKFSAIGIVHLGPISLCTKCSILLNFSSTSFLLVPY